MENKMDREAEKRNSDYAKKVLSNDFKNSFNSKDENVTQKEIDEKGLFEIGGNVVSYSFILKTLNEYEKLKQDNAILLEALKYVEKELENDRRTGSTMYTKVTNAINKI